MKYKNNQIQQREQHQNQFGKFFIANLNVNVTCDNIHELFGLKTTKYLRSITHVEMPLNNKRFYFRHCIGSLSGVDNFLQNHQISLFP